MEILGYSPFKLGLNQVNMRCFRCSTKIKLESYVYYFERDGVMGFEPKCNIFVYV
jgi:hypothetical protein